VFHQNEKKESNLEHQRQFEPGKMGFLWLFYGFATSPLKKATEFNTSSHVLMPSGFDETIGCNTSKKQK